MKILQQRNLFVVASFIISLLLVGPAMAYDSTTYSSSSMSCNVTDGACSGGTVILKMSDYLNGHAELFGQSNYSYKVCCTGTGISNSCSGNYATVLKLSDVSNAHVEKGTLSNYAESACLSASGTVSCDYAADCSTLGANFVCMASISADTNAHVAECSTYSTKVCCSTGGAVTATNLTAPTMDSYSFCSKYYESGILETGRNTYLEMPFDYNDGDSSAHMASYEVRLSTTNNVATAPFDSGVMFASANPGTMINYQGVSVRPVASTSLMQITYGETYYWWVRITNSNGITSAWASGPSFTTPSKRYPIVRVIADKTGSAVGTNVQFCSGADTGNTSDPCYKVCWPGTGTPNLLASGWKCSVCFDASNDPVVCSNAGGNTITWKPVGAYQYVSGNSASDNPIMKFTIYNASQKIGLEIGTPSCGNEMTMRVQNPLPVWKEISPFKR